MKKRQFPYLLILLVGGVLLDLAGSMLANALKLPLYLDCLGIMLASAMGGYIPGIIVGYVSNLINGVNNPTNMYYAFISVLIAFSAGYFAKNGWFKRIGTSLLSILVFTLIGGGIGSIITWLIFGFDIGDVASSSFTRALVEQGTLPVFWAQMVSDLGVDLVDKTIHVILLAILLKLIPENVQRRFTLHGWKQTPLSHDERKRMNRAATKNMSLKNKIILLISIATIFMATATAGISFLLYHRATIEDHTLIGTGVAELAASVIDGDRVQAYLEQGRDAEGYQETEEHLYKIRESSHDIEYIYAYQIREDGCHVVFDLDTDSLKGAGPGEVIAFDDSFSPYIPALLNGDPIDPIIAEGNYGWLMTAYAPVKDSTGKTVCYAAADINMGDVRLGEISFITRVVSLFSGFFLVILAIGLWLAEYSLLLPINTMTVSAGEFAANFEEEREEGVERFRALDIRTGDEIENLYDSFAATMASAVSYLSDSEKKSASLTRMQNGLILVLADLVESRDSNTGDHVRKTSAYARMILVELRKRGLFTETISDDYIEDVANAAPLHDVGKIPVPDSILNKPGRLTEEEFEIMKNHTTAGNEIIGKAIALVSDSGYLQEARNLATYHHEKWNGTGYPKGLKGDEIPLSARVMAVADVFDALVSKRSYKEPFPFEKAVSIIEEGSGSHFDPRIVEAFLGDLPEVQRIYETHMA